MVITSCDVTCQFYNDIIGDSILKILMHNYNESLRENRKLSFLRIKKNKTRKYLIKNQ